MRALPRPRQAFFGWLIVLAALLAVPATAAACGESAPPQIKAANVSPNSLPWEGGTIVLTTEVESDCGVEVYAEVNTTEGTQWSFQILPTGDLNGGLRSYKAEIAAPPNYQEWSFGYQFTIRTLDDFEGSTEAFAGETEIAPAPQFDEAPYVSNVDVTPRHLSSAGGWVSISADVSDNRSVNYVFANIMLPNGTLKEVPLEPVSSSHFVGHYQAPVNYGTAAQKYLVTVFGEDDIGQQRLEEAGSFTVAGRPGPLSVDIERTGAFGNVTIGKPATRVVTVHNSSPSGSKWIKASLAVAGSSFTLRNAVSGKIDITIGPGESRRFWLDFKATALGPASGTLTLTRADGAQPPIVLNLSGKGIPPAS
jgi:hypothetical protein